MNNNYLKLKGFSLRAIALYGKINLIQVVTRSQKSLEKLTITIPSNSVASNREILF